MKTLLTLLFLIAQPSLALCQSNVREGFENSTNIFTVTSSGGVGWQSQNSQAAHSGASSFKTNTSNCGASCFDSYRVDLVHTFPQPVEVLGVGFWAREGSTTSTAWGGKIRVGHDSTWDLDWWGVVNNNQAITGAWQYMYVPIGEVASDIKIRIWDITSRSTMWLDDIVIYTGNYASYCTALPNSTGGPAEISANGSPSVAANDLSLKAVSVPNQPGIFFYGPDQWNQPFGNGTLCVNGVLARGSIVNPTGNTATYLLDNTNPPSAATQITPGSTWNFQYWFRDPSAGGAEFNLSDAVEVTFAP